VDFFLSIRDGEGYSQGVTNPSADWSVMYQAGCTTMAAWANAANCAILAESFRLMGGGALADSLRQYYTAEAVKAFRYAEKQEWTQLDDLQDIGSMQMRGRDFKQMAAAYLYNLTGDTAWEDIFAQESMIKNGQSPVFSKGRHGFFGRQRPTSPASSPATTLPSTRTSSRASMRRLRPTTSPTWTSVPRAAVPTTAAGRCRRTCSS